jgi:hypothetical protein
MKIMKKIHKIYNIIIGNDEESKKDIILNHLIDTIELRDETIYIKTKKNLLFENDGHVVTMNSGMNVTMAKQIHLNPKIDFNDNNFNTLKFRLDEARKKEQQEFEKKALEEMNHS